MLPADNAAEEILGRQLASLEVKAIAVAVVRRLAKGTHPAVVPQEAILRVALHIAEQEVLAFVGPGRPLGPQEAGGHAVDGGDAKQELPERWIDDDDVRIGIDLGRCVVSPLPRRIGDD